MLKTNKRALLKAIGATAMVAGLSVAPAWAQAPIVLKMAHVYNPGNIWFETAEAYAKAVETRSGGKVKIQIAASGSTGDWPASIEGLKIGTNDIVLQSIGTLDRYNPLPGLEAYPYLIRDLDHFKKVYFGPVGAEFIEEVAKKSSFRIIGAGYRGARWLTSNKPVKNVNDIKGLKLRVPPLKMYRMTWDMLGASPVPMGAAELFTSMQQGVVDGQENPLMNIHASKLYEVNKFISLTGHKYEMTPFLMSKRTWDKLSDADRKALQDAATEATALQRKLSQEADDKLVADLKSKGVRVDVADKAAFEKATAAVDDKWMASPIGEFVKKVIAAARAK